jgi:putative transposase
MPRRSRAAPAGWIFHVVNRGARRGRLFEGPGDYQAFEKILVLALRKFDVELLAYCLMPNHWHLVIRPRTTGALSRFMHWLTTTHACRWHLARGTEGQGAVYQGRFKAIPVEADRHLLWVCRYVERNALRSLLVTRAEEWPWSSLWQRQTNAHCDWLSPWPATRGDDWVEHVNRPQTEAELEVFRRATQKGTPYGGPEWQQAVLAVSGVDRRRTCGRPRKRTPDPLSKS